MTNFRILEGKALKSAIKGASAKIETFAQLQHELCYGAILHLDRHNGAEYVQAVYDMMPTNYKGTVRTWFLAFGKCTFDADAKTFAYAKAKKGDLDGAFATSPAGFQKQGKAKTEKAFDEVSYLESVVAKLADKGADPRVIQAIKGAITLAKTPVAAPKAKAKEAPETQEKLPLAA